MKKFLSAVLSVCAVLALSFPAFADVALPPHYYRRSYGFAIARSWGIAIVIGVVIVAVAIIILAVKYKREQNAADAAEAAARAAGAAAQKPDDQ